ncbi:uncharacterized protein LAESUDRAFT_726704 [Laetiporus sulphureus 93-53]|uniref:FUN34 transmembrane protein n=1 Tax=Laetiporus sulphureus 93-53 TaxID=1314785 RepID=A0A165DWD1_9APHY|nr:uncharacterized protein LAESUDRAFT_726704 [Laetiporus sulphureus 93-53]KZT05766.1 hypothetical protein LAESUDRAFT_726704 [Laetiporus sulphureus 93-53]
MSSRSHSLFEKAEKAECGEIESIENVESDEIPEVNALPPPAAFHHHHTGQLRKLGNPGPLGLFAFASTTLMLSLFNVSVRNIHTTNAILAMTLFVGGLAQFTAGMWEFACGNTFGASAFSIYGGFWMSYATLFIPGSGIAAAYADNPEDYATALGIYLMVWFIITFLFVVASTRRNVGLCGVFFFVMLTFMLLGISELSASPACAKAGGWTGIIAAFLAFYVGQALLMVREESWFTLPLGTIPQRVD